MQKSRSIVRVLASLLVLSAPFGVAAPEKSHVTSEQVTRAVQELEKLAQQKIQENTVPGLAIAVVFQDKVAYAKGFGVRDVNTKTPVDADTVFQLASVSKPIGSTVVAALVGEGKISWDSKLNALDPSFEMFDPWVTREITIATCTHIAAGCPITLAICSRISGLRARKYYIASAINIPIAVFVRITRTRILA
jgi:CubicO group peptidase (beta-lactamase class C family)